MAKTDLIADYSSEPKALPEIEVHQGEGKDAFQHWESYNQPFVIPDSVKVEEHSVFDEYKFSKQTNSKKIPNNIEYFFLLIFAFLVVSFLILLVL